MSKQDKATLHGNIFLLSDNQQSFAAAQVDLLAAIDACGSISGAAKHLGMSYKTAWDRIDAMNNMSEHALVVRSAGGVDGGGTTLTDMGRRIVAGFQTLQAEHAAMVGRLGATLHSIKDMATFMRETQVRTSARNQYRGVVTQVTRGAVNTEVQLQVSDSVSLIAIITNDSQQHLDLKPGDYSIALIKSSWVLLSKETTLKTSARNKLIGRISRIIAGAVNSEVALDLGGEKLVYAIVTNTSVADLNLNVGDLACAFFKASSVILIAD
jgi:molybdate transport system regulatory protein